MQRREAAVRTSREVRGDHVSVQLRIKRPGHPMQIRRRDQPLAGGDPLAAVAAADQHGGVLELAERAADASSCARTSSRVTSSAIAERTLTDLGAENVRSSAAISDHPPTAQASGRIRGSIPAISALNYSLRPGPQAPAPRAGAGPLARRLAAARVVIIGHPAQPALVIAMLTDASLPIESIDRTK